MFTLFHHPFCPHSRFIRLALGEHGLDLRLVEERVWERREAFLALNPACATPVLISESQAAIPGAAIIAEYLDETHGAAMDARRLLPTTMGERVEVRRLMAWFNEKFFEEASNPLVTERIYKRFMSEGNGGGAPAADVIRAAKANVRYHLAYIGWLARTRNFLAGDRLTYADLAAGAHGDMDWLASHPERRTDPRVLWESVRSVIMLGVNYGPDESPLAILDQRSRGAISVYAQGDDYHDLIKKRLKTLARWLVAASGGEVKVFVDT